MVDVGDIGGGVKYNIYMAYKLWNLQKEQNISFIKLVCVTANYTLIRNYEYKII